MRKTTANNKTKNEIKDLQFTIHMHNIKYLSMDWNIISENYE